MSNKLQNKPDPKNNESIKGKIIDCSKCKYRNECIKDKNQLLLDGFYTYDGLCPVYKNKLKEQNKKAS